VVFFLRILQREGGTPISRKNIFQTLHLVHGFDELLVTCFAQLAQAGSLTDQSKLKGEAREEEQGRGEGRGEGREERREGRGEGEGI
jgi:hypothetical protein